ncbi:MAG: hypothetical protein R3E97_15760 [Candidatus Eisenbacteria bacterium]
MTRATERTRSALAPMRALGLGRVLPLALALALPVFSSGCGSTRLVHPAFEPTAVAELEVGMPLSTFETRFGAPDIRFETKLGTATDHTWNGVVYKYLMAKDPNFGVERWITNTFVFCKGDGEPKLNNWDIEQVHGSGD